MTDWDAHYQYKEWGKQFDNPRQAYRALQQHPPLPPEQQPYTTSRFSIADEVDGLALSAPLDRRLAEALIERRPWLGALFCKRDTWSGPVAKASLQGAWRLLEDITISTHYPPEANPENRARLGARVLREYVANIEHPSPEQLQILWQWTLVVRLQKKNGQEVEPAREIRSRFLWRNFWARFNKLLDTEQLEAIYPVLAQRERLFALTHAQTTPKLCVQWLKKHDHSPRARNTIAQRFDLPQYPDLYQQLRQNPTPELLWGWLQGAEGQEFRQLFGELVAQQPGWVERVITHCSQQAREALQPHHFAPLLAQTNPRTRERIIRFLGQESPKEAHT